ncbi:MAG: GH3 auxin-responsive promoter family protein [Clostridiales bacterium]|nr:GH3 auxin-responsive promoter family protein [uncultured Anaerosporobacter sp.]MBS5933908.1 GH3 auxin-responsive promoter family protein [Clostridiales bacterium]
MAKMDKLKRNLLVMFMDAFRGVSLLMTHYPMHEQKKILKAVLKRTKDTEVYRKYGLTQSMSIEEFKKKVPLTTYVDYEAFVKKMMDDNAKDVLTKDEIVFYTVTSGTTSKKSKIIPHTKESLSRQSVLTYVAMANIIKELYTQGKYFDKGVNFISTKNDGNNKYGIPYGLGSCQPQYFMGRRMKGDNQRIVPAECCMISGERLEYICWLFALSSDKVTFLATIYPLYMISAYNTLQRRANELLTDLEKGTLSEDLQIPEELRKQVLRYLKPNVKRAEEIRRILQECGYMKPTQIWPKLTCIVTARGGTSKYYVSQIEELFDGIPVFCPTFNASEGMGAFGYSAKDEMITSISSTFLEFIPMDKTNEENPETLLINEVKVGELYEIVFTVVNGFYRYRMGDIVKITGFIHKTPKLEFQYRSGSMLSVAYEKVTEDEIIAVMSDIIRELNLKVKTFVVGVDYNKSDKPNYKIVLESDEQYSKEVKNEILSMFEKGLMNKNVCFEKVFGGGMIAPTILYLVKDKTIEQYYSKGKENTNQVKISHISENEDFWRHIYEEQVD